MIINDDDDYEEEEEEEEKEGDKGDNAKTRFMEIKNVILGNVIVYTYDDGDDDYGNDFDHYDDDNCNDDDEPRICFWKDDR